MTTFKNYEFFPVLKASAEARFGGGNYLLEMRDDDGTGAIYPPTHTRTSPVDVEPGWWQDEFWWRQQDDCCFRCGHRVWRAIANPGWPLTIEFEGRTCCTLTEVVGERDAWYGEREGQFDIRARLTDDGLDVWDPRVLAEAPFPAILGRNYIEDSDLAADLHDKGVEVKETELGRVKGGILSRLEYTWQGQPRVAYEVTGQGYVDSFLSTSVVLAEPRRVDERDLHWVARMVKEAPDPRKQ